MNVRFRATEIRPGDPYNPEKGSAIDPESLPVWIRAEDFVVAIVGPFQEIEDAQAHIGFCKERGDSAVFRIIGNAEAEEEIAKPYSFVLGPEEDREFILPDRLGDMIPRICSVCKREMSPEECGDEFPEERVCDPCAGIPEGEG